MTLDENGGALGTARAIPRPHAGLLFMEVRALLELAACLPAFPALRRAPTGDGHPVLVLPGFLASDFSTRALRAFLRGRGYDAYGWRLGRNLGPSPHLARAMVDRLRALAQRHGRRVSIVGWSLGGIYARELARRYPSDVRQVITLASPFRDIDATNVPRFARAIAERGRLPDEAAYRQVLAEPLRVPSTAIYSRTDGIAAWQSCRETPGPQSENIEVASSHCGIGHHPVVLLTIADRLAQPEGAWRPFEPPPRWRWPLAPRVGT
jgi:pimeloyl-ACP methyl ester carboxylesterase